MTAEARPRRGRRASRASPSRRRTLSARWRPFRWSLVTLHALWAAWLASVGYRAGQARQALQNVDPAGMLRRAAGGALVRLRAHAWTLPLGLLLAAAVPRLVILFGFTDPQNPGVLWHSDTYHHWQIAYLSREIGFGQGLLRLWDFKGMEYFWGLLHPLLLATLFTLTGSVDILIPRLLGLAAGSASTVLLFLLARRHFGPQVGLAAFALAAFNPVALFHDTAGMQEPVAIALILAGLLAYPGRPFWAGVLLMLSGMTRAEFWLFGGALVAVALFKDLRRREKLLLALGWALTSYLYMSYLLVHTGNPLYVLYWNFLGNAAGDWLPQVPQWGPGLGLALARLVLLGAALAAAGGALWVLRTRPPGYLLLLLLLGSVGFTGASFSLTQLHVNVTPRLFLDRYLLLPYLGLGLLLALGLFRWLPRRLPGEEWRHAGWVTLLALLALSQWSWKVIDHHYQPSRRAWEAHRAAAAEIASHYREGTVSIPEDQPWLTYLLVREHGIGACCLQGQKYDAFAYLPEDPFARWEETRPAVLNWLSEHRIRLLVFYDWKASYREMIRREPGIFRELATVTSHGQLLVYEVRPP